MSMEQYSVLFEEDDYVYIKTFDGVNIKMTHGEYKEWSKNKIEN